jgi:hypothetical protein
VKVINAEGDQVAELSDNLAAMLLNRGWSEASDSEYKEVRGGECSTPARNASDDEPVPMSYIPGVVAGVTMSKIKQLVNDGAVPFTLRRNAKLVKPSDVVAALETDA